MFHELGCDEFRKASLVHTGARAAKTECYLSEASLLVAATAWEIKVNLWELG